MNERVNMLLNKAKSLPHEPGCYLMRKEQKVIYIGKAKDLCKRVQSYFNLSAKSLKTQVLVSHISDFDFLLSDSEVEALITENILIKKHTPRYNIRLRDDKSYPYVVVNKNEPFSRPLLIREVTDKKGRQIFGPFVAGSNIKEVLRILIKLFKLRDCSLSEMKRRQEPCILHQMQQCSAPCRELIDETTYGKQLALACSFFEQQESAVLEYLQEQMYDKALCEEFELAAIYRDSYKVLDDFRIFYKKQKIDLDSEIKSIDIFGYYIGDHEVEVVVKMIRHGKILVNQNFSFVHSELQSMEQQLQAFVIQYYLNFSGELPSRTLVDLPNIKKDELVLFFKSQHASVNVIKQINKYSGLLTLASRDACEQQKVRLKNQGGFLAGLNKLQELLSLAERPEILECYDIAIWQGASPAASQIVFENGQAVKQKYRHYHLQVLDEGNNDFAMMREVLSRRLAYGDLPDVFVVDGGIGQMNIFREVLKLHEISIPVVGIAKSKEKGDFKAEAVVKSEERLFIAGRSNPYILKNNMSLFRILTQMRDEAHRFSRRLHHKEENKRVFHSQLDDIPHIGPRIKRRILKNLQGPLEDLIQKEVYQIMDELRVSVKVAKSLKDFFLPK